MEIRPEAFHINYNSPGWQTYTDEHQKRLDNDALIAADEISRDLMKSLWEHVAKHRKTWKQGHTDVLTGYCCKPHLRQLRSHLAGSIAEYNEKLRSEKSSPHTRIGLRTFGHGGTYIRDTRPSSAASSTRDRRPVSAYPCGYELVTGPDPDRCSLKPFYGDTWSEISFAEHIQAGTLVLQLYTVGDRIKISRWFDRSGTMGDSRESTAQLDMHSPFAKAYVEMLQQEERFGGYGQSRSITDAVNRLRIKQVGDAGELFRKLVLELHQDQRRAS